MNTGSKLFGMFPAAFIVLMNVCNVIDAPAFCVEQVFVPHLCPVSSLEILPEAVV